MLVAIMYYVLGICMHQVHIYAECRIPQIKTICYSSKALRLSPSHGNRTKPILCAYSCIATTLGGELRAAPYRMLVAWLRGKKTSRRLLLA